MDKEGKPNLDLADELESLRDEIAQLQSLIEIPASDVRAPSVPADAEVITAASFPPNLLEDGPLGMAFVDTHFHITRTNAAFRRVLGHSQEEIQSLHLQDLVEDSNTCRELISQVFAGVLPTSKTEAQFIHKNREKLWVQFTVSAIPETPESPKCCLVLIEDISERKWAEVALQTEKKLLEGLIGSSLDGIVAFDRDGILTVWNPGMERIFGVSKKDALGRPAFQACPSLAELGEDKGFRQICVDVQFLSTFGELWRVVGSHSDRPGAWGDRFQSFQQLQTA